MQTQVLQSTLLRCKRAFRPCFLPLYLQSRLSFCSNSSETSRTKLIDDHTNDRRSYPPSFVEILRPASSKLIASDFFRAFERLGASRQDQERCCVVLPSAEDSRTPVLKMVLMKYPLIIHFCTGVTPSGSTLKDETKSLNCSSVWKLILINQ
jgi:hypothetical protein